MAKKSSKASTPSWRTLMRRAKMAESEGRLKDAATLRQKASALRHSKSLTTSKPRKARIGRSEARFRKLVEAEQFGNSAGGTAGGSGGTVLGLNSAAPQAEFAEVDAANDNKPKLAGQDAETFVDGLCKLARSKNGKEEITSRLISLQRVSRYEGERRNEESSRRMRMEMRKQLDERIVCAFLAEVALEEKLNRGLPRDQVWNLSALTITKIADALSEAGYSPQGRKENPTAVEDHRPIGRDHQSPY